MDPIAATKSYYDQHGQSGWTHKKTNSFYLETQFSKIAPLWPSHGTVLDIGCAAGIHVPLFLGIGRHVHYHGLDNSTQFLTDARRRYPQLIFTEGNIADNALFADNQFSGFWANSVLMHVPLPNWDELFAHLERITSSGSYGYLSLPIAHPNAEKTAEDIRHFTVLTESEQEQYLSSRKWNIITKGSFDGFTTTDVWRWYIVRLPTK